MDNASTHHFEGLLEMVEAWYGTRAPSLLIYSDYCVITRGQQLIYLPSYFSDFIPIKEGFSAMKAWIQCNQQHLLAEMTGDESCDMFQLLWEAVFETMTPDVIAGWYCDSGLLV